MRIGCLWIPDLPLVALVRAEPELAALPLALAEPGPSGQLAGNLRVIACTEAAVGVEPGQTLAAAQAICPGLHLRAPSAERTRAAAQAALEAAATLSPRIEAAAPGLVYLDLEGLSALFPDGERSVAQTLAAAAEEVGLRAAAGIAEGKTCALLAARAAAADLLAARALKRPWASSSGEGLAGSRGVQLRGWLSSAFRVIARQEQRAFLAELPLAALEPQPELLHTLQRFGLFTLGELAALPAAAAAARLGPEGALLHRAARGDDSAHLVARALPERFEEGEELEWDASSIEPLLFVWKGLLDRLAQRLSSRGLAASELSLLLRLGSGAWDERQIALSAPTREVGPLLQLLRLEVEARPPGEPVRAVRLSLRASRARGDQLALFGPRGASPAQLEAAVARLSALLGEGRVGQPVAPDTHRPSAAAVTKFDPPPPPLLRDAPVAGDAAAEAFLSARALRPPRSAEVRCDGRGSPVAISDGARLSGRVLSSAGPWRTVAEWWTPQPLALDTFDLEVAGGLLLRASRELASGAWWIEAVYD